MIKQWLYNKQSENGKYYTRKELDILLDGLTNHLFLARYIREENSK